MAKVRNISPTALQIQVRGMWRLVEPDEVTSIPDEDLAAYVERETGGVKEPSDLWVEAADIKPVPVEAPAKVSAPASEEVAP